MNTKANTILFLLAASLFCIILTGSLFLALISAAILIMQKVIAPEAFAFLTLAAFAAAVVLAYFIYRAALSALARKIDFGKYFDPLFLPGIGSRDKSGER